MLNSEEKYQLKKYTRMINKLNNGIYDKVENNNDMYFFIKYKNDNVVKKNGICVNRKVIDYFNNKKINI